MRPRMTIPRYGIFAHSGGAPYTAYGHGVFALVDSLSEALDVHNGDSAVHVTVDAVYPCPIRRLTTRPAGNCSVDTDYVLATEAALTRYLDDYRFNR